MRQAENSGKRFKRGATASSNMIASDQPGFVVSQPQASDQICSAKTNRFMADVDPPLMKKVFYIAKRERKPNIKHHSQADDLRARSKVPEWGVTMLRVEMTWRVLSLQFLEKVNRALQTIKST